MEMEMEMEMERERERERENTIIVFLLFLRKTVVMCDHCLFVFLSASKESGSNV